jgi:hypothetical protein
MFVHVRCKHVVRPNWRWHISASSSDLVAVDPPAPQVTVTKSGRRACDMRSNRVWRFANPYATISYCHHFCGFLVPSMLRPFHIRRVQAGQLTIAVFGGKNSSEK